MLKKYHRFYDEVGTDEAGRGCLAGPVTAAAVILPKGFENYILNDSKQLSELKRELLKPLIESESLAFAVAHVYPLEIDEINILNASLVYYDAVFFLKARMMCSEKQSIISEGCFFDLCRTMLETGNTGRPSSIPKIFKSAGTLLPMTGAMANPDFTASRSPDMLLLT